MEEINLATQNPLEGKRIRKILDNYLIKSMPQNGKMELHGKDTFKRN